MLKQANKNQKYKTLLLWHSKRWSVKSRVLRRVEIRAKEHRLRAQLLSKTSLERKKFMKTIEIRKERVKTKVFLNSSKKRVLENKFYILYVRLLTKKNRHLSMLKSQMMFWFKTVARIVKGNLKLKNLPHLKNRKSRILAFSAQQKKF